MNIQEFTQQDVNELQSLIKQAPQANFYNHYAAMACWLEHRPLQLLKAPTFQILFATEQQTEAMMPAGTYGKDELQQAIEIIREANPGKELTVYGLDEHTIEYIDKKRIFDIEVSYIMLAEQLAKLENKKLRNAVTKLQREGIRAQPLLQKHKEEAHELSKEWATRTTQADTAFQKNIIDGFLEHEQDPGAGYILHQGDKAVGITYIIQDGADERYANVLVNITDKTVNGISEYLLHLAAKHAREHWNCEYINYGGTNPRDNPGLHTYKKKFGWDHILTEYSARYDPLGHA